jgi:sugar phosphate isomerase/epimerase
MSALDFVQKAAELGAAGAQICDNLGFESLTDREAEAVRDAAERAGLFLETGSRGLDPFYLRKALAVSRRLGAGLMRLVVEIDRTGGREGIRREIGKVVSGLRGLLDIGRESDTVFALENHASLSGDDLLEILASVNDPRLGICLDTMNSVQLLEHPIDLARKLAPYVLCVHLKDFRMEKRPDEFAAVGTALGEGELDLEEILRILGPRGLVRSWHVELYVSRRASSEETLKNELVCVRQSLREALRLLKRYCQ